MMKNKGLLYDGLSTGWLHYIILFTGPAATAFFHLPSAGIMLLAVLIYIAVTEKIKASAKSNLMRYTAAIEKHISALSGEDLERIPFPVTVAGNKGTLIWYNKAFAKISEDTDFFSKRLYEIAPKLKDIEKSDGNDSFISVTYNNRRYNVYYSQFDFESTNLRMLYWIDDTRFYKQKEENELSRPVICHILMDNYDELTKKATEGERSNIAAQFFNVLSSWTAPTGGILRSLDRYRYLLIFEQRHLKTLADKRFTVLESVRSIMFDKINATLSLGLGAGGNSLYETDEFARRSLDMALGRGGDQAVLYTKTGFEFFGGRAKSPERRSRIKSRVMASVLTEMIDDSANVLIMGHRYSDFDCLGSSMGLHRIAKSRGKNAHIVMDLNSCLVREVTSTFSEEETGIIVSPEEALKLADRHTLLFVVDTQRKSLTELPELIDICENVVIIDHHRRSADAIDNVVVGYHDPQASSASEMVTELVQYALRENTLKAVDAKALMAGIMLDTKTFTVKSGVRTFEAAAYLRQMGADPSDMRRYFSNDFEEYRIKAHLISHSQLYRDGIAIALWDNGETENMKQICAQAADEMLNISDVSASFVIVPVGSQYHVSARSSGGINVQLIMEHMGGGGNFAAAGVQIPDISSDEAKQQLIDSIDAYYKTLEQ